MAVVCLLWTKEYITFEFNCPMKGAFYKLLLLPILRPLDYSHAREYIKLAVKRIEPSNSEDGIYFVVEQDGYTGDWYFVTGSDTEEGIPTGKRFRYKVRDKKHRHQGSSSWRDGGNTFQESKRIRTGSFQAPHWDQHQRWNEIPQQPLDMNNKMRKDWIKAANRLHQDEKFWTAEPIGLKFGLKIETSEQSASIKIWPQHTRKMIYESDATTSSRRIYSPFQLLELAPYTFSFEWTDSNEPRLYFTCDLELNQEQQLQGHDQHLYPGHNQGSKKPSHHISYITVEVSTSYPDPGTDSNSGSDTSDLIEADFVSAIPIDNQKVTFEYSIMVSKVPNWIFDLIQKKIKDALNVPTVDNFRCKDLEELSMPSNKFSIPRF
uniref:AlNc14C326G10650 protein n=1 Tax=Albugo laibachii Nc14 TaxID=890382 RepID=F0WGE1_9STRA|nr:AlNc14C91G5673 [Albugo laibachii Nc14]CCA25862.1 AlNc14C326G10650 [Albugo laibachii Nc14]|eukprot:CCA25862.1 AlNc14C326G10650 [Albugo laibachii Nc14]